VHLNVFNQYSGKMNFNEFGDAIEINTVLSRYTHVLLYAQSRFCL